MSANLLSVVILSEAKDLRRNLHATVTVVPNLSATTKPVTIQNSPL
jgi:hypothetical protein